MSFDNQHIFLALSRHQDFGIANGMLCTRAEDNAVALLTAIFLAAGTELVFDGNRSDHKRTRTHHRAREAVC
jgi:hypothetical protein